MKERINRKRKIKFVPDNSETIQQNPLHAVRIQKVTLLIVGEGKDKK